MKARRAALLILGLILTGARMPMEARAGIPPAPTPLSPSDGANVTVPFTISWSAPTDPNGIVAYNWQVSAVSSFSSVVLQDSTNGQTQDTVAGLANGSYFWRVQAVSGAFEQGSWSAARAFTVTGAGPGSPSAPTLDPTVGYSTFHPYEVIHFTWSPVPGAASYVLEAATDQSFPVSSRLLFDNIPDTTYGFAIGNPEGNYWARVRAVSASGVVGAPSNLIAFSVFFGNPLPPPPAPRTPANGTTLTLPVTLTWTDVANPQPSGYDLQIAKDASFATIEESIPQLNDPTRTVLSLTSGTKFWRVHSVQGNRSPTTAAVTAWSATGTFTVSSAPARPVSVSLAKDPLFSGESTWVQLQLTAAVPSGGSTIALSSSNPGVAPVPATVAMQGSVAWMQFMMAFGQVVAPTPVTITATLNGASASGTFTVLPPSLKSLAITPGTISGGASAGGVVMLNGAAPSSGAVVTLSSDSPLVSPPSTVTVAPGSASASFSISTGSVSANTSAVVVANWNGTSAQSQLTLTPQQAPTSLALSPSVVVGLGGNSTGTVRVASAQATDQILQVTSSHPSIARVNGSVMIPAGVTAGGFNVSTTDVSAPTVVTLSVSGGGVTKSATLTVNPSGTTPPPPSLSSFKVAPTSVSGGTPATGTVTLPSAAPAGGTVVTLTTTLPNAASVPPSVTVPAGATSASFTVTTFPGASTTATLSARLGDTFLFAPLSVTQPVSTPPAASLSSVGVSPASVVGGTGATGTVTLTSAAPAGGALVTLSSGSASVSVPASVTVPAGASSATFAATTTAVSTSASVTVTAAYSGTTRTTSLTVTPPSQGATLTVTATGKSGERITSNPANINVPVGATGSAPFTTGVSITLTVSNGKDAIWSGACSSGGKKTKTCALKLTGAASVTANVQ